MKTLLEIKTTEGNETWQPISIILEIDKNGFYHTGVKNITTGHVIKGEPFGHYLHEAFINFAKLITEYSLRPEALKYPFPIDFNGRPIQ